MFMLRYCKIHLELVSFHLPLRFTWATECLSHGSYFCLRRLILNPIFDHAAIIRIVIFQSEGFHDHLGCDHIFLP